MILEEKDIIKAKIGYSPDEADACALTYAEPVSPRARTSRFQQNRSAVGAGYSPFTEMNRISGQLPQGPHSDYNPFK